ncbi:hypothetical protein [Neisseria meningitidis serogroup B]|uniref:Uncharacterized protein n=1 Tax=Neisseria meningitidis serogroup B TaxID=491 RepID=A0A0H5DMK2_NEIMI|nr:hypothetical protein [Neisseria meningitidis serogroup B]
MIPPLYLGQILRVHYNSVFMRLRLRLPPPPPQWENIKMAA